MIEKLILEAVTRSTCQKRITVCVIYDRDGDVLSVESNRCDPEGGRCHRMGLIQTKGDYDTTSQCNWTHAEMMALKSLPEGSKPYCAVIYGHTFLCDPCEQSLKEAGVEIFETKELL